MNKNRLLAAALTLCLLVGLLPFAALGARADGEKHKITVGIEKSGTGTVRINDGVDAEGDTVYLDRGTEVTLTATPAAGYRLAYWVGPNNRYYGEPGTNTLTHAVGTSDASYTAVFIDDSLDASAEMADIDLGKANPGYQAVYKDYFGYYISARIPLKNTGRCVLAPHSYALDEEGKNYFAIGKYYFGTQTYSPIQPGVTQSEYVVYPKAGLGVGTYTATLTLVERCEGALAEPVTATVTFTVTDDPVIKTSASPSNGGTVTGAGVYKKGTSVTLTATPNEHYAFSKWSDGSTDNPHVVTASEPATYTAYFVKNESKLTVNASPAAAGTVQLGDRPAAATDNKYYNKGTAVTLKATPAEGYRLAYWIGPGGLYVGDVGKTEVNASVGSDDYTYTAYFVSTGLEASAKIEDIDLGTYNEGYDAGGGAYYESYAIKSMITIRNTGGCKLYPAGLTLDDTGKNYFGIGRIGLNPPSELSTNAANTMWYVYAKPDLPVGTYTATITLLERCQGGLAEPVTAKVTMTVTESILIKANVSPEGGGTVEGTGTFRKGTLVSLTAKPSENYAFDHWERADNSTSKNATLSFAARSSETVTAYFKRTAYSISVAVEREEGGSIVDKDGNAVTGSANYAPDTSVTYTAVPDAGWCFLGWTDNGSAIAHDVGAPTSVTVTANPDHALVARFALASLSFGRVTAPEGARLILAQYEDGRLTSVKCVTLANSCRDVNAATLLGEALPSGSYRLMLVDGKTFAPLCASYPG